MVYRGTVKNGVVVVEGGKLPPEGALVSLRVVRGLRAGNRGKAKAVSLYERLKPVIGLAGGLPRDLAKNHDHYLHGRPKR